MFNIASYRNSKYNNNSIAWLTMRLLVLLSLLSLQSYAYAEGIANCGDDKRFRVTADSKHYKLQLCTSRDTCTEERDFIKLDQNKLCEFCETIPEIEDCDSKDSCREHVDSFLNDYCEDATFNQRATCTPPTRNPITPTPCTSSHLVCSSATVTVIVSKVITERELITYTHMSTVEAPHTTRTNQQLEKVKAQTPVIILGALTGLLLVILVLVITGWVWTYCATKNKTNFCEKCKDCEGKTSYPNPTYGMTTEKRPAVGTATWLHSQEEGNGQTHNANNRENHTRKEVGEGGSGEEHMYHILEKPMDDDYEDPDKNLEKNTAAAEYETPVPLK